MLSVSKSARVPGHFGHIQHRRSWRRLMSGLVSLAFDVGGEDCLLVRS
jgi:hypothetical protein